MEERGVGIEVPDPDKGFFFIEHHHWILIHDFFLGLYRLPHLEFCDVGWSERDVWEMFHKFLRGKEM